MTPPRPHLLRLARLGRLGGSVAATALPLAHAADYLEGAVLAVAFVVFLGLVARERARARRAAPADRLDAAAAPGDEVAAAEPAEPGGGESR